MTKHRIYRKKMRYQRVSTNKIKTTNKRRTNKRRTNKRRTNRRTKRRTYKRTNRRTNKYGESITTEVDTNPIAYKDEEYKEMNSLNLFKQ
jgi:hypothetical protein